MQYEIGSGHEIAGISSRSLATSDLLDSPTYGGTPAAYYKPRKRLITAAYWGVLLFCIVYFFRPQDIGFGLDRVPFAKITGGVTCIALLVGLLAGGFRLSREGKLLLALYAYLCICIPTSLWIGGSYDLVVNQFSKTVMIAIAVMCVVTTTVRLRKLLLVQVAAMLTLTLLSYSQDLHNGRMFGVGKMFVDPNDFALNLCIILPFCVAFLLSSRSWVSRILWMAAVSVIVAAVVGTFSRGGFLALMAVILAMAWQFRIPARLVILSLVALVSISTVGIFVMHKTSYLKRLETIIAVQADTTGSAEARQQLFLRSLDVTAQHPIVGIGPGQFMSISGNWHATHNSYTQLTSESGIPSLVLFVILMWRTLKNLRSAQPLLSGRRQARYLAAALYSSTIGYLVGAMFLSTAYWLVPYLLVAYASALRAMSKDSRPMKDDRALSWKTA